MGMDCIILDDKCDIHYIVILYINTPMWFVYRQFPFMTK